MKPLHNFDSTDIDMYINSGLPLNAETIARAEAYASGSAPMIIDADPDVWAPHSAAQPDFGDRFKDMWERFHSTDNSWFFPAQVAFLAVCVAIGLWITG